MSRGRRKTVESIVGSEKCGFASAQGITTAYRFNPSRSNRSANHRHMNIPPQDIDYADRVPIPPARLDGLLAGDAFTSVLVMLMLSGAASSLRPPVCCPGSAYWSAGHRRPARMPHSLASPPECMESLRGRCIQARSSTDRG